MFTSTLLATTLYLTPIMNNKGPYGVFGIKYTHKISDQIFFKVRTYIKPQEENDPNYYIKAYVDINF